MATRIVLAEDNQPVREMLAELLQQNGFEVTAVANGAEAEAAAMQDPDLLVLDLLLPKKQGFQVLDALKAAGKTSLKVVVISGVFKTPTQQKEAVDRYGVKGYLVKPFENDAFLSAVNTALGRAVKTSTSGDKPVQAAAPLPPNGSTLDHPVGLLAFRAQAERHSGILELANEAERMRLFFYRGALAFAQSSRPGRNLGAELVRRGRLTAEMLGAATAEVGKTGQGLYRALVGLQLVDEATARETYKSLVPQICQDAVPFVGKFKWLVDESFARMIPAVSVPALTAIFEGLKATPADTAARLLERRRTARVARGPSFDRLNPGIESAFGMDASRSLNGRVRINQLVEMAPNPETKSDRIRQLFALICTQAAVTLEGEAAAGSDPSGPGGEAVPVAPPPVPVATPRASPPPAPSAPTAAAPSVNRAPLPGMAPAMAPAAPRVPAAPPAPLPPELAAVLAEVETRYSTLEKATLFEVLGVTPQDDAAALKKAYFALAGKFHADKFSGVELGDARAKVDAVFGAIAQAYDVLSKPDKRAEYDAELNLKASGATVNIAAIFEAETLFTRAEHVLERGDFAGANKLLERAVELDPKDLYRAYKLYVGWRVAGCPRTPVPGLMKEIETLATACVVPKANEFLGQLAKGVDDLMKARVYFRKMLEDPQANKAVAQRELDAIKKRMDEEKNKPTGIMGKLFKS